MRDANFFYRDGDNERTGPVLHGVAQGVLEALALPNEGRMPDQLRELAEHLVERDALGRMETPLE